MIERGLFFNRLYITSTSPSAQYSAMVCKPVKKIWLT